MIVLLCYLFQFLDKAATIKGLYDTKMLTFNEVEWRPEAWLSFLMTRLPAGINTLPTTVPRVEESNIVLTQAKAVRKHARAVAREAQGLIHTTKGLQANHNVVDLTDTKVKSVKRYHYIKPEATMDACSHLKRKQQAIKESSRLQ